MNERHLVSSPLWPVLQRKWWVCAGLLAVLGTPAKPARADALKSAQVSRVFNDVRLLPEGGSARAAVVSDTVTGKAAVQTGAASRTELTFSDRTLTRLGGNSYFSFVNGTRDLNLGSGTMLLQVPKDAGGATIHTAGITAGITGTTLLVEYNPKSYSKLAVLEGTVRVSLTGHLGESVLVHAGEILIVPAKAKALPEPVKLDLNVLYASSGLIKDFGQLPSRTLIDREIVQQTKALGAGKLQDAALFIAGSGTQVQAGNLSDIAAANKRITAQQGANTPVLLGGATAGGTATGAKYGPLASIAGNTTSPGVYEINTTTTIRTDPYITTNGVQDTGRIYRTGTTTDGGGGTSSVDGPADVYLLGAATTKNFTPDSQGSFNAYFGAVDNLAAFRFSSLALLGTPASITTTGGPTNLALIADADITSPTSSQDTANAVISLDGLREVLLATRQGSITLNGTTFQNTDGTAPNLTLYAQGGSLGLEGTSINVGGGINLHSDTGMSLDAGLRAAGNIEALSYGPITAGANFFAGSTGGRVDLAAAGGSLTFDGAGQGSTALNLSGDADITLGANSSLACSAGAITLTSTTGGINASGTMSASGDIDWNAPGNLVLGAGSSVTSSNGQLFLQSTNGSFNFKGTATAQTQLVLAGPGGVTTGANSMIKSNTSDVYLYSTTGPVANNGSVNAAGTVYLEGQSVTQNGAISGAAGFSILSNADLTENGTATTQGVATVQASGALAVNNTMLSADTLKIQTFGNNGVLLIGGSSVLTGSSQLSLFVGGSAGRIEFTGNTTLNSNVAAVLTAAIIRIDNNVTVTISGPTALLYANTLQFTGGSGDGSTSGAFGGNGTVLAGSYTNGSGTAQTNAHGGSKVSGRAGVAGTSIKPTLVRPVTPTYDGRYGLASLVDGSAQSRSVSTGRGSGLLAKGSPKTAARTAPPAREQSMVTRTSVLR